jgi:hypothetical protein
MSIASGQIGDHLSGAPAMSLGRLAERLCVIAGFVGTTIGLSLQVKSLAGGATSGARDVSLHHRDWPHRSSPDRHHDVQS